ncbi:MAG: hypothetical protein OHK0046_28780 [Anaerolineae bacterium]
MGNLAQLAPLVILIPAVGAFINYFWGMRMGERASAIVGTTASALSFVIALLLFSYLGNNNYEAAVVNPPFLDSWIRMDSIGLDISWQLRVDTLSVTMMLFVTFVGTLIHLYSAGYMHGDPRFPRFFAYLNMFLMFMLILISGNNFLMMFVGWEGVGLCSYLLIGFWWDKPNRVGWKNSNAARKAFIVNRIGDFGVLMAVFLIFWSFGTLDFYKPGEVNNVALARGESHGGEHGEEGEHAAEGEHEETGVVAEGEAHSEEGAAAEGEAHSEESAVVAEGEGEAHSEEGAAAEGEAHGEEGAVAEGEAHGEEEAHGEGHSTVVANTIFYDDPTVETSQLGVFGQTRRLLVQEEEQGSPVRIEVGPVSFHLETMLVMITLFMLLGAAGKSAQIPLFVWLPDAMAGPTPVSALIHAATMVTAGVYMMVRSNIFFYNAELTSFIVTLVGTSTALVAGFIAIGQFDIKRVLAYSTVSQLGFMVAAVGIGAYPAAMFHMITHAFFKALLFLGSGSVIHGMEHGHHEVAHHDTHDPQHSDVHGYHEDELGDHKPGIAHGPEDFDPQDMRNMGGLSKKMPITYWTYLIATLALAGIFPFAGFWSKDEILADGWEVGFVDGELRGYIALGALLLAAGFTAFYMWRQIEMVFHGQPRTEAADHAHESPWPMTVPLVILGFFSLVIGFINIPSDFFLFSDVFGEHRLGDFLENSIAQFHIPPFNLFVAGTALAVGLGGILFARSIYGGVKAIDERNRDPLQARPETRSIWSLANARMYWDEIYFRLVENPFNVISRFLANVVDWDFYHDYFHDRVLTRGFNTMGRLLSRPFDLGIIDGAVNGVAWLVRLFSGNLRQVQTGYVRTYAIGLLLGVVFVIVIMLLPLING